MPLPDRHFVRKLMIEHVRKYKSSLLLKINLYAYIPYLLYGQASVLEHYPILWSLIVYVYMPT